MKLCNNSCPCMMCHPSFRLASKNREYYIMWGIISYLIYMAFSSKYAPIRQLRATPGRPQINLATLAHQAICVNFNAVNSIGFAERINIDLMSQKAI